VKTFLLSQAKNRLSEIVEEVRTQGEPVQIRKRDKDAVVIVKSESFKKLQNLQDEVTRIQLREALRGKMYPLEKALQDLQLL